MKRRLNILIIFIICFFLGACITIQTKSDNSEHAFVSEKVISDNEVSMQADKKEIEKLKSIIKETDEKMDMYESELSNDSEINDTVDKTYRTAMEYAGFTQVKGEGITVFLDDGVRNLNEWENANDIIVHDLDLMIIINELIKAGAEAISINGERYISTTEIACSGHTVKINGRTHARPFYINVIGDQVTLYSAMTIPGGYGDILTEYGLIFKVEKSNSVIIPAYKGDLTMNYIETKEGGE